MRPAAELKKGIIRKGAVFRHKLDREETQDGSYLVIARPDTHGLPGLIFYPLFAGALLTGVICAFVPLMLDDLPLPLEASRWWFWNVLLWIPGALFFLVLSCRAFKKRIPEKREGGLKFVFYHAFTEARSTTKHHAARYEIYYLGQLRDAGTITDEHLVHRTNYFYSGKSGLKFQTHLFLKSPLTKDDLDREDPLRPYVSSRGFAVFGEGLFPEGAYRSAKFYKFVKEHARELRDFLGFPLESANDCVQWSEEALKCYESNKELLESDRKYLFLPEKDPNKERAAHP